MKVIIKIFDADCSPTEEDFRDFRTRSYNTEFISNAILQYEFSSELPQNSFLKSGFSVSRSIAVINGVSVHMVLTMSLLNNSFGLWTFPESECNFEWFEKILYLTIDVYSGKYKEQIKKARSLLFKLKNN